MLRYGNFIKISELAVLSGDIIYIDTTDNFKADVEILRGDVITDESFLTEKLFLFAKVLVRWFILERTLLNRLV